MCKQNDCILLVFHSRVNLLLLLDYHVLFYDKGTEIELLYVVSEKESHTNSGNLHHVIKAVGFRIQNQEVDRSGKCIGLFLQ